MAFPTPANSFIIVTGKLALGDTPLFPTPANSFIIVTLLLLIPLGFGFRPLQIRLLLLHKKYRSFGLACFRPLQIRLLLLPFYPLNVVSCLFPTPSEACSVLIAF